MPYKVQLAGQEIVETVSDTTMEREREREREDVYELPYYLYYNNLLFPVQNCNEDVCFVRSSPLWPLMYSENPE